MFSNKFIAASKDYSTFDKFVNAPYLRKSFVLEKLPKKGILTICGLGFYRLWINGKEITKGFLAPYICNPDEILYYDEYDLSKELKEGKNVLGILLGNGFLNNEGGAVWDFDKASFRSAPKVAFSFEGDDKLLFEGNDDVRCALSPILFDDLRAGERYNANLEIEGWNEISFDDSSWKRAIKASTPKGEAYVCHADPIKVVEELSPIEIRELKDGSFLYVFPRNAAGFARVSLKTKKRLQIAIDFGELLTDGDLNTANIGFGERTKKGFNQHLEIKTSGKELVYVPSFCYFGYRYAKVSGISKEEAKEDFLTMLVARSAFDRVSSFLSSSDRINHLYEMAIHSMDSNVFYFPTDCPHREKNGWTGDIALSADYFCFFGALGKTLKDYQRCLLKAQREDGALPGIIPTSGWGYSWGNGPAWDSALFDIPYSVFQYDRDDSLIRLSKEGMDRYLHYVKGKEDQKGLLSFGLGDWCETDRNAWEPRTPLWVTDTLTCVMIARKAIRMFHHIGALKEEAFAKQCLSDWSKAFRSCFLIDGKIDPRIATQTALAMTLEAGVLSEEEDEWVYDLLLQRIHEANDHFQVGVLGARRLFDTLGKHGDVALGLKLIAQDSYPSFGYLDKLGEKTLWEEFTMPFRKREDGSLEPDNPHYYPAIPSLNHHFWGHYVMFFIRYVAGLDINPDWEKEEVTVNPSFEGGLSFATASRITSGNKIEVSWKKEGDIYHLDVTAPKGMPVRYKGKDL